MPFVFHFYLRKEKEKKAAVKIEHFPFNIFYHIKDDKMTHKNCKTTLTIKRIEVFKKKEMKRKKTDSEGWQKGFPKILFCFSFLVCLSFLRISQEVSEKVNKKKEAKWSAYMIKMVVNLFRGQALFFCPSQLF